MIILFVFYAKDSVIVKEKDNGQLEQIITDIAIILYSMRRKLLSEIINANINKKISLSFFI